ncbi:MAG: hypothetical protein A2X36_08980 [Elusimicrobia bacterium GWA2_69_24]|nr:MAG: hypothetical protein A2X36_08980 [Elusimicrobia bacterium GWA2_69_24]HBL18042.1 hypothetical protein [Elusimicrobiota bacterium]
MEGRRVGLRPLADSDAEALFDAVSSSREGLKRRLRWVPAVGGAEDERRFIADAAARAAARTAVVWGIFENRTGRLAGVISLVGMEDAERAQGRFGAWVRTDRQDRGFAVEAGRLAIEFAFRRAGLHRVHARLDPANRPFRKVLKKLGLRYEGCLRSDRRLNGRWVDQECWGLLRSEWKP